MGSGVGQISQVNSKFPVFFPQAGKISLMLDYGRLPAPPNLQEKQ
jgi:hypothetical protein